MQDHPLTRHKRRLSRRHSRRRSSRRDDYDCEAACSRDDLRYSSDSGSCCDPSSYCTWLWVGGISLAVILGIVLLAGCLKRETKRPAGFSSAPNPDEKNRDKDFPGDDSWEPPDCTGEIPLFGPEGPQFSDVKQTGAAKYGDCWLLAALAATAHQQKEHLKSIIRPSSVKGFFEVDLWFTGKRRTIFVDARLPPLNRQAYKQGGFKYYWFAYIEKAFAKYHGGYKALKDGTHLMGLMPITGEYATDYPDQATKAVNPTLKDLSDYLKKKYIICLANQTKGNEHGFAVVKVVGDAVHLFDPNNSDTHQTSIKGSTPIGRGVTSLSWSTFQEMWKRRDLGLQVCWSGLYNAKYVGPAEVTRVTVDRTITPCDLVLVGFPRPKGRNASGPKKYHDIEYKLVQVTKSPETLFKTNYSGWFPPKVVRQQTDKQTNLPNWSLEPNQKYEMKVSQGLNNFLGAVFYVKKSSGASVTVEGS